MDSQNYDSFTHNLTIEQKKYAAEVLNETDENRENAIAEIKRWIQESDLRARTDDFFILRFLRACKFNIENTKTKIRNYQNHRAKLPEWYANRDPLHPKLQELLDLGLCLPLRKLDNQGRMVFFGRAVYNPAKDTIAITEIIKIATMIVDIVLRDSVALSLYGIVIIIDIEHITLHHIAQLGPRILMNAAHAWQNCYPVRIQLLNCINMPEYAKVVASIFRNLLSNKLKERVHIYTHKTARDCFTNIPANILPIEYGGTDGTVQEIIEYWKKMIVENREWFIDDEKYKPISK